jgi:thiamine biosynthesis lipoprotein
MAGTFTRRRFIAIAAVAASGAAFARAGSAASQLHTWRGVALGAEASIRLAHPDGDEARRLIDACVAEIARLERIFSLYRTDSALSRLNADGRLELPPLELVELLGRAASVSQATGGVFDVTVQPLWQRYAAHFATPGADPGGPDVADVLPLVDWRGVHVAPTEIALARAGMAVTLNGIAQGYVTDRVADLLRAEGMDHVLIDLGETRALGTHPNGRPWRIGLTDPADPTRIAAHVPLAGLALATSGGYGTRFEVTGRHNHLIDPRTGRSAPALQSVSVLARDATTADAASTALSFLEDGEIGSALARLGALEAHLLGPNGGAIVRV